MEINFDKIKNMIVKEEIIDHHTIHIEFKASNQPVSLSVTAFIPSPREAFDKHKKRKKLFASKKKQKVPKSYIITAEAKKKAIVEAFKRLSVFYEYDTNSGKWIYKSPLD